MEKALKVCRICLTETDFNIPLHSIYCRKTKMIDKILVCLKIIIEETELMNTICHRCAHNVEEYYDFYMFVKKAQAKQVNGNFEQRQNTKRFESSVNHSNRRLTSFAREEVFDADYTFSFLEVPEERKEPASSPFFSYFSPPPKKQAKEPLWKAPRPTQEVKIDDMKNLRKSRRHSSDLFESQSQVAEEPEARSLDWKLTPDESILKRLKDKCFGRANF